ncbi:hypothetical protein CCACVL1_21620 [Corchorus capsularis]|uniref:Uncharacterized protein n=1 Tax=Corchorus capsularis TaxID=210143 RepID=A0A1R3H2U3_COCAP|nr:hypothetical protein CCACVL1_21620 [Corchorus capsularis]
MVTDLLPLLDKSEELVNCFKKRGFS